MIGPAVCAIDPCCVAVFCHHSSFLRVDVEVCSGRLFPALQLQGCVLARVRVSLRVFVALLLVVCASIHRALLRSVVFM